MLNFCVSSKQNKPSAIHFSQKHISVDPSDHLGAEQLASFVFIADIYKQALKKLYLGTFMQIDTVKSSTATWNSSQIRDQLLSLHKKTHLTNRISMELGQQTP